MRDGGLYTGKTVSRSCMMKYAVIVIAPQVEIADTQRPRRVSQMMSLTSCRRR